MSNNLPFALTDAAKMNRAIANIAASGAKLDANIDVVSRSAVYHAMAEASNDAAFVRKLWLSFPNGSRRDHWLRWLEAHFPVHVKREKGKVCMSDAGQPVIGILKRVKDVDENGAPIKRKPRLDDCDFDAVEWFKWEKVSNPAVTPDKDVQELIDKLTKDSKDDSKAKLTPGAKALLRGILSMDGLAKVVEAARAVDKAAELELDDAA